MSRPLFNHQTCCQRHVVICSIRYSRYTCEIIYWRISIIPIFSDNECPIFLAFAIITGLKAKFSQCSRWFIICECRIFWNSGHFRHVKVWWCYLLLCYASRIRDFMKVMNAGQVLFYLTLKRIIILVLLFKKVKNQLWVVHKRFTSFHLPNYEISLRKRNPV